MQTLGHTDKFVPHLKLINEFPVKTLPFPILQFLHEETKDQINQLLERNCIIEQLLSGIIELNFSECDCPIFLVKKILIAQVNKDTDLDLIYICLT